MTMIMQCFLFWSNLFLTKVTMIHLGKFSKIRVQAKYENIFLETSFYILDTCLKFEKCFKIKLWLLKISKKLYFNTSNS